VDAPANSRGFYQCTSALTTLTKEAIVKVIKDPARDRMVTPSWVAKAKIRKAEKDALHINVEGVEHDGQDE